MILSHGLMTGAGSKDETPMNEDEIVARYKHVFAGMLLDFATNKLTGEGRALLLDTIITKTESLLRQLHRDSQPKAGTVTEAVKPPGALKNGTPSDRPVSLPRKEQTK